jgi:hypothetical protein
MPPRNDSVDATGPYSLPAKALLLVPRSGGRMSALSVRIVLVLVPLLLLSVFVPAAVRADTPCWSMLDAAITRRAEISLPPYLSYDIVRSIDDPALYDDRPLVTTQSVLLRTADGEARVVNSLFGNTPMHTDVLDPGYPFIGPSGPNRSAWFADIDGKAIAIVHAHAGKACDDLGAEVVNGHRSEHLRVTPYSELHPGLRDAWIGIDDGEIWRAVVAQPIDVSTLVAYRGLQLTNCTIDVAEQAGGAYVSTLLYRLDNLHLTAAYAFTNYRGLATAPAGSFPDQ